MHTKGNVKLVQAYESDSHELPRNGKKSRHTGHINITSPKMAAFAVALFGLRHAGPITGVPSLFGHTWPPRHGKTCYVPVRN